MAVWVYRPGHPQADSLGMVEKHLVDDVPQRTGRSPYIIPDTPGYRSPLGTGWIEGRAARREDMKRGQCREVDPSEYKAKYLNEKFARKHGLPFGECE